MRKIFFSWCLCGVMMFGMADLTVASSVYIDASGAIPTISGDFFAFIPEGSWSLLGPTSITSMGSNAWDINFKVAGGDFATFGGSNRGLELVDPITGKISESFGFNSWYREGGWTDVVAFDAYLYTSDDSGNLTGRTPRIYNAPVATAIKDGTFQLAMSNMGTAYSTFNVYLKGGTSASTSPAPNPEPATMLLFGTGIAGMVGLRLKRKKQQTEE